MSRVALVVDDSMLIRHTISRFLGARGFRVECANNGREALALLPDIAPDLIVTDLQMPEISGSEFIAALKARPETAAIPVVVVAARQSGGAALGASAQFIIYKDIDIREQLERAVDGILLATK